MAKCDNCHRDRPTKSAVISGKFGHYCQPCIASNLRLDAAGAAAYRRQADRDAHEIDLLQPWLPDGTPNKEFITHYPQEANDMFSKEELEKYG